MINLQDKYLEMQVEAASPQALVTMLYDGAVRFLRQAKANLTSNKYDEADYFLDRAQRIVSELSRGLDMSQGEISASFQQLYGYMERRILQAASDKDVAATDEVIHMLMELRYAWAGSTTSA